MRQFSLLIASAALMLSTSCVHRDFESPSFPGPVIAPTGDPVPVALRMDYFDTEMTLHVCTEVSRSQPAERDDQLSSRHLVRIFNASNQEVFSTALNDEAGNSTVSRSVDLNLSPGEYTAACWTDIVASSLGDNLYDTSEFPKVTLTYTKDSDGFLVHKADLISRDAFCGRVAFRVESDSTVTVGDRLAGGVVEVEMRRPMACFRFEANDIHDFIKNHNLDAADLDNALKGYEIVFRYAEYMPCSFDVSTDAPVNVRVAASFMGIESMRMDEDGYIALGSDFVFVHSQETSVSVGVEVRDVIEKKTIAKSGPYVVPLKRNKLTVVRGRFLTATSSPGMNVDTSFAGDYNIPI